METKEEKKNCCAICGAEYEEPAQPKTTDGLNLMTSVQVRMMVRFCTRCGYVNHSVSMEPPKGVDMAWLQSDAFRSCDGIRFKHEFASGSYQFHMVRLADQDYRGAMLAVSLAAQICEETGDDENAETCLKKAAELAQKQYQSDSDPMMLAMWCEYLRRSGQFETVDYARHFAKIRTYLETCARNGINEFEALLRLTQDNPFSLSEVLSYSGS